MISILIGLGVSLLAAILIGLIYLVCLFYESKSPLWLKVLVAVILILFFSWVFGNMILAEMGA